MGNLVTRVFKAKTLYFWKTINWLAKKMDKNELKRIGRRIRELRKAKGLSQEALSFECELDRSYLASIERGERNITINTLHRIVDSLGLTRTEFFKPLNHKK